MKTHLKAFLFRGMLACWGGPVILAVVYGILGATGTVEALSTGEVCRGILTITLMAFLAGGVTVVYQIERLPLFPALLIHGVVLYLDYLMIYLVNGWIAEGIQPLLIFTGIFVLGYAVIWLIVYGIIRKNARDINRFLSREN